MVLAGVRVLVVDADAARVAVWSQTVRQAGANCESRGRPGKGLEALLLGAVGPNSHQVVVLGPTVPNAMRDAFRHTLVGALAGCKLVIVTESSDPAVASSAGMQVGVPSGSPQHAGILVGAIAQALGRSAPADATPPPPAATTASPLRILLAEDNPVNQEVAEAALRAPGWQVTSVFNGAQAVAAVRADHFHAVVMDIQMPEMDGLTATRTIRASAGPARDIPIIAMTANALPVHRAAARDAGMNGFVAKPISASLLVDTVRRAVEGRAAPVPSAPAPSTASAKGPTPTGEIIDLRVLADLKTTFGPALVRVQSTLANDAPVRLQRMREAARTGDYTVLGREAHSLKSSSGTFGLKRVSGLSKAIEYACSDGRHSDALSGLETLESVLHDDLGVLASHM